MNTIRKAPIIHLLSQVTIPKDVISFGQGIPFFSPPKLAIDAAKNSMMQPKGFQYSTDAGWLTLRETIAEKVNFSTKANVDAECNVMVTSGANQAFMNAVLAITSPGDELIFLTPSYFNYVMAAQLADCKPVLVETTKCFQPDVEKIKNKISKKTKAIVTISPNNPTGAVYSKESLKAINQFCKDHQLFHISDEVYEYFVYDDSTHVSPLCFDPSVSHTISLFSLSKAFALSGYRIGYMIHPDFLSDDLLKAQDTIGICAPSIAQAAALKAIPLKQSYCAQYNEEMKHNREIVMSKFDGIPGIHGCWTKGAYYFFITVDSSLSSLTLAKQLIETYGVIVLPGSMFDMSTCSFRLSYGNLSSEKVNEGMNRLIDGIKHLK